MAGYQHSIRFFGLAACCQLLFANCTFADQTLADYAFKEAIFKLDVTFSKSKRDQNDKELCKSEGTGFVVDSNHVITAKHVYDFDQDCGAPTILAKSFANNSQFPLTILDSSGDVALLRSQQSLTDGYSETATTLKKNPCAIPVLQDESYFEQRGAVRYGVPGGLEEPQLISVDIGSKEGQFSPLVIITPIEIYHGESGGPIVKDFLVVGMIEALVVNAKLVGLMTGAKDIHPLLIKHSVGSVELADVCSPILYARRKKQALLKSVKAEVIQSSPYSISGAVMISDDETIDKKNQDLLTETTRKAVEDSLNRIIPQDGVRVVTRSMDSGKVTFDIIYTQPIPMHTDFIGEINSITGYQNLLPDVLEFDTKARLNGKFEQQIRNFPNATYLDQFAPKTQMQTFDPTLPLNNATNAGNTQSLLPDAVDMGWNNRLENLNPALKAKFNQQLQILQ
jgi:hypothetical protein